MIYFTAAALAELRRRAADEYPEECCGVLIGRNDGADKTVTHIYPVRNTAESGRSAHFCIEPPEILRAELYAEQNHLEIAGFYHSHPNSAAVASAEDMRYMIPGYYYPIISVRNGSAAEIRCFVKVDNAAVCEELILRRDNNADNSLCRGNAAGICE
ncbi:MAG: Mov34/MPN/PAD-1 family protein [Oscillospiraceae bacterium]